MEYNLIKITWKQNGFRPRTGDYFFIENGLTDEYFVCDCCRFRPRTGDYFFIGKLIFNYKYED